LLNAYEIKKPLFSYHKFNGREAGEKIIQKLKEGKNIALITDAGMPVISDPGNILTEMLVEEGLEFTVIPGACAFVSALVLSGLDSARFCFLGFLPQKASERKEFLEKYKNLDVTLIFYCAPHDIKKDIETVYSVLGDRNAVAVKEITKLHERAERFKLKDGLPTEPKGEYVLVVEGAKENADFLSLTEKEHIELYLSQGMDKKDALKRVAKERGVAKSTLYKYTIEDYSGSYQFSAFGDAYQRFAALLKPNVYVYLTGVIQQRGAHMKWFKPKPVEEAEYEFALQQVQLIQDAQKDLRSITLQIPIENIQPDLIDELAEKNQQFAGETSLRLQIFDTIKQNVIMLNAAPIKLDKESYNWLKEKKQEEVLNYLIN
jgi:16S rRNA (cytidine1402-2'-O)-methyltransferase